MNSVPKTQENPIMKFIEGVKLLFVTLGEGQEAITPEERIEESGIKELQQPIKAEKILEEKASRKRVVAEAEVSETKAAKALEKHKIEETIQDKEIEKE